MTDATMRDDEGREREARIERMLAETRKFVEEGLKLSAEQRKLSRDRVLAPWQVAMSSMAAGAALFGAGAAFIKILGH